MAQIYINLMCADKVVIDSLDSRLGAGDSAYHYRVSSAFLGSECTSSLQFESKNGVTV